MPRFALLIEYDGGPFRGWQRQASLPTVQGTVETALARLEPDLSALAAAGRTDTGVHALGQVAHIDLAKEWEPGRLRDALNYHLRPAPIVVRAVAAVAPRFHARFSAIERRYVFRLSVRRAPPALDHGRVWHVGRQLDVGAMREAAAYLIGRHDFTTFRAAECQADSPVRTLDRLAIDRVETEHGPELRFDVRARSFLHSQVRSLVGTLERVGAGAWAPERVGDALAARDRAACGPVCPPHGLYLAGVGYEEMPFSGAF